MKDIPNFENLYAATEDGRIWSYYKNRFLKPSKSKNGYLKVLLTKEKQRYNCLIHRLIALTFIDNPNNLPVVNHKDENPLNNNVNNLEWCTYKYNSNYGTLPQRLSERMKQFLANNPDFNRGAANHKSIPIRCIETNEEFPTFSDAAKWCGLKDVTCFIDYFKDKQGSAGKHPETKEKLHWQKYINGEWIDAIPYEPIPRQPNLKRMKKVRCIETNEIFESISAAQKYYNIQHIGECCNGTRKTADKKHWEYIDR